MQYSKNDNPEYIASVLGARLKRMRLNQDMTQLELANRAWVERRTVLNAEKGNVRLADLIAILRALGKLDNLDSFLPEVPLSPIQLHKLQGRARKRASGNNKIRKTESLKVKPKLDW